MQPMDPLDGDTIFTITTRSAWIIWYSNGDNGTNGDSFMMAPLSPFIDGTIVAIYTIVTTDVAIAFALLILFSDWLHCHQWSL